MVDSEDTVPARAMKKLLNTILEHGYTIDQIIDHLQLDYNPLTCGYNKQQRVSSLIYSKAYKMLINVVQDEAFGLSGSHRRPPGTMRLLGLFVINCKNLRTALQRGAEFNDYCDSFFEMQLKKRRPYTFTDRDSVICRFYNPGQRPCAENFVADANALYMIYRFYSWLVGKPIPLMKVHFVGKHSQSRDQRYSELFKAPIEFCAEENTLELSPRYLEMPLIQSEDSLWEFLRKAPYQLIANKETFTEDKVSTQVLQTLSTYSGRHLPGAETMAEKLCISPRTLHRQLRKEGSGYQQLKDQFRKDIALTYIRRPELTINTIAALMGFEENSAFYRSFKKWTGMSPGQYRRELDTDSKLAEDGHSA